ncbi:glutathione S-transferase family protein [soil metagenome]
MIKLLGRATSGNVQKVIFMLEEIGEPYKREDFGRQFNNTATAEYLSLNPNGKVPTLVDGDVVIWESNTILRYLAATKAVKLTGSTPAERTQVERWMDWVLAAVNPGYLSAFVESKKPPEERAPDYEAKTKDLIAQMKILDAHLTGRNTVALDRVTIADMALGPILKRCADFPIGRPSMPNVERWLAELAKRPAFAVATGAAASKLTG